MLFKFIFCDKSNIYKMMIGFQFAYNKNFIVQVIYLISINQYRVCTPYKYHYKGYSLNKILHCSLWILLCVKYLPVMGTNVNPAHLAPHIGFLGPSWDIHGISFALESSNFLLYYQHNTTGRLHTLNPQSLGCTCDDVRRQVSP